MENQWFPIPLLVEEPRFFNIQSESNLTEKKRVRNLSTEK